jgi:hypothetical protein
MKCLRLLKNGSLRRPDFRSLKFWYEFWFGRFIEDLTEGELPSPYGGPVHGMQAGSGLGFEKTLS